MSSGHVAKLAALEALEAGRLSASGQARLERHLASCELCRATRRGLRIKTALVAELEQATPRLDLAKVQAALGREASAIARARTRSRQGSRWGFVALAAAAAIGLVATLKLGSLPARLPAPIAQPSPSTRAERAPIAFLHGEVTALRGHGSVRAPDGSMRPLALGSALSEGDRLELEADSEAHVRVAEATGFVVEASSTLELRSLRREAVVMSLDDGAVTSRVHPLAPAERFEVLATGYTVAVRGTHFRVATHGTQLTAAVDEGHVVVIDAAGKTVSDLFAPAQLEIGAAPQTGSMRTSTQDVKVPLVPRLADPTPAAGSPLRLPAWPAVQALTIDGTRFAASAELALRVPRGDVTLYTELEGGRRAELLLQVPEGGLVVPIALLDKLLRAEESKQDGRLAPDAIRGVLTSGMPALQRCYEHSLKQRPDIAGRVMLRIVLDASGRVRHVSPRNNDASETAMPDGLVQCIGNAVLGWRFPAPGGPLTFDAPIRFTRQHP